MFLTYLALGISYICAVILSLVILSHIYEADANRVFYDQLSRCSVILGINLILVVFLLVIYFKDHSMPLDKNPIYLKRMNDNLTAILPKLTTRERYTTLSDTNVALLKECNELTKIWEQNRKYIESNITLVRNRVALNLSLTNVNELNYLGISNVDTLEAKLLINKRLHVLKAKLIAFTNSIYKT